MNDVSHHEATMGFLYGYVVRKNISRPDSASNANALPTPVKEIFPTAPSSKTKKNKSPATKKRDRERLVKWLSQKRSTVS